MSRARVIALGLTAATLGCPSLDGLVLEDGGPCVDLTSSADNCGACGHSCLGSRCINSKCDPQQLWAGNCFNGNLAVDANGWIYFGPCQVNGASTNSILRCQRTNCSTPDVVASSPFAFGPFAPSPDGVVYSDENHAIVRWKAIDGSTSTMAGPAQVDSLSVAPSQTIWALTYGFALWRCDSSCTAVWQPFSNGTDALLADDSSVYFVAGASEGVARFDGANVTSLDPAHAPGAIAADANNLYYADQSGAYWMSKSSSGFGTLASANDSTYARGNVVVDDTFVYFTGMAGIGRAPKAGGDVVRVVESGNLDGPIAVDTTAIYYLDTSGLEWVAK